MHGHVSAGGRRLAGSIGVLAIAAALLSAAGAGANPPLTLVSVDPFTNTTSQHATELEPDTFAHGNTVVATFQVGRFFNGGASDTGFARSGDGGATWTHGFLPGLTFNSGATGSPYERVSDPTVAYDAVHATWLISSVPITPTVEVPTVFINRSTNDGVTWSNPIAIPPPVAKNVDLDKNWTVCDNVSTAFRGHCYTELDNFGDGGRQLVSTSTDGGLTWSVPIETAGHDKGLGGQPVVQPSGRVIVPFEAYNGQIQAYYSDNGGASWSKGTKVESIRFHRVAGNLRTSPLPTSAEIGGGKVYVAWEDCRFRKGCTSNDIVFVKSSDGLNWSDPARVPIDDVTSTVDHFIPGLAVDPATSGAGTHLALTYYLYPTADCGSSCSLEVGYISSPDGGAHWSDPTQLAGPMSLGDIALTSQGPMVGDYISTSFNSSGLGTTVFAVGNPHTGSAFDEAMYAPTSPLAVATAAQATHASTTAGVVVQVDGVGTGETHHALKND